jgi:two-component system cell cycle sensor histidine kinase/response regulator CckA
MLDQVLLNLVVNARDALPAGDDLVIATSARPRRGGSGAGSGAAGKCVCLQVTDNGTGIAPGDLDRILSLLHDRGRARAPGSASPRYSAS